LHRCNEPLQLARAANSYTQWAEHDERKDLHESRARFTNYRMMKYLNTNLTRTFAALIAALVERKERRPSTSISAAKAS
jgi:hypothetical protein